MLLLGIATGIIPALNAMRLKIATALGRAEPMRSICCRSPR